MNPVVGYVRAGGASRGFEGGLESKKVPCEGLLVVAVAVATSDVTVAAACARLLGVPQKDGPALPKGGGEQATHRSRGLRDSGGKGSSSLTGMHAAASTSRLSSGAGQVRACRVAAECRLGPSKAGRGGTIELQPTRGIRGAELWWAGGTHGGSRWGAGGALPFGYPRSLRG